MRRALAVATLLLLLVLAGCGGQTDPATNVTATSATLNGQDWCKAGESGTQWWRYRLGINPWQETTHANWSCSQDRNQSVSTTITGLTPGSHYQYEICWTLASYPPVCANADGLPDNAVRSHEPMDAFDTKDPASRFFGATSGPPFLNGLHQIWADDASRPDPVQANRWGEYSCGRADGQQQKSFNVHDLYPGEFTQFPSGGPNNAPYYRFHAGQGRNIWTGGTVGRCELGYPGGAHYTNTIWFNNGDHRVILFSTRLPAGWDINQTNWRGFGQVKVDEDIGSDEFYPALGFAQYNGIWGMSHFGAAAVQAVSAAGDVGNWVNMALDITFSTNPSQGKVSWYFDRNLDGFYETAAPTWTGQTLATKNGQPVHEQYMSGLYEGTGGDSLDLADMSIWG